MLPGQMSPPNHLDELQEMWEHEELRGHRAPREMSKVSLAKTLGRQIKSVPASVWVGLAVFAVAFIVTSSLLGRRK